MQLLNNLFRVGWIWKKCWHHLFYAEVISFFVKRNVKKLEKSIKIVNIDGKNLHISWTNWETFMKCLGKMWHIIILTAIKNQGFTFSLEDTFLPFWKNYRGYQIDSCIFLRVKLIILKSRIYIYIYLYIYIHIYIK